MQASPTWWFVIINPSARARSGLVELIVPGNDPLDDTQVLNVRPAEQPWIYEQLAREGFSGPTADDAIDHLLALGATVGAPAERLPPERREVSAGGTSRVRLSDHAPVVATFDVE